MADSPYDTLVEAFHEAKKMMIESTKVVKADIVRPLDPNAKESTRAERREAFSKFMLDPLERESEFLRLQERFNLSQDRPIPRRLVDYIIQGLKEEE